MERPTMGWACESVLAVDVVTAEGELVQSFTIWYGWNPVRPLPDMAFSMEANVYVANHAVWSDAADDERVQRWVSESYRALEPMSTGTYPTYLGDADLLNRPAPFMAADNFRRLDAVRDQYDPHRRFPDLRVKPGTTPNEFEGPNEFHSPAPG